ncbi:tyrosine-protein phosphatase [Methylobacterium sp. Leaf118]|uniref:tyrosine-protein phosphatase n=1 Tax=Methylobacterium sp. Leaf118 TaxID=2876562 RepID=UPI001E2D1768|nr:tyrosine-protein phosphatase [Methylobacterium sp. Leaf118]
MSLLKHFRSSETRTALRLQRVARWDRPIEGMRGRISAWFNMLFVDYGVFRLAYLNLHTVCEGRLWRSAQPAPHHIAQFAAKGVRTIVNLRGVRDHGAWQLQKEACDRFGITLVEFMLHSRDAPKKETLLAARSFFDSIAYPAVMHCKSGADRAGLAAALFLILHEGRPVREAAGQLSLRYGHFRFAKTGIIDAFFAEYLKAGEPKGQDFIDWVEHDYDPDRLKATFKTGFWSTFFVDGLMRRE